MRRLLFLSFMWLATASWAGAVVPETPADTQSSSLALSSLTPGCTLEKRWVGFSSTLLWGVWLRCGGLPVLLDSPLNLLGKVKLDSSERALEFVRFFSTSESYTMFALEGICEVRSGSTQEPWETTLVPHLGKRFEPPRVTESRRHSLCHAPDGSSVECTMKEYKITRVVIMYDQNVYRVTETVSEDGYYNLDRKILILRDSRRFGVFHLGSY